MRTSQALPHVTTPMDDLRDLANDAGPFLSVYLSTDGAVANAADVVQVRWTALRRELVEEGAPESALAAVDELIPDAHRLGNALVVIADASGARVVEHVAEPLDQDRASWRDAPDLTALIDYRQQRVPYVLVLADRGGADLHAYDTTGRELTSVAGDGDPESKVAPGGQSQPRFQQRAEDDWLHEAKAIAAELVQMYDRVNARLVVIGGDTKALHYIQEALRSDIREQVRVMDYGRAVDGSDAERDREVHRLVATEAATETVELLERFKEERGQHDLAVDGAKATMAAIERGQVEVLLVSDGHLSNELLREALRSGASVRVVPENGPIADGVGGLLRWSDAAR